MTTRSGPICPSCGEVALAREEREEPVFNGDRYLGWDRRIAVFDHGNGRTHTIAMRPIFKKGA